MSPAIITLIIGLVEELIKIEPTVAAEISALINNQQTTPADWIALKNKVLGESFQSLAPDTKLQ
jgi:hypothetical protein